MDLDVLEISGGGTTLKVGLSVLKTAAVESTSRNLVCSPMAIQMLLSIILSASEGQTEQELKQILASRDSLVGMANHIISTYTNDYQNEPEPLLLRVANLMLVNDQLLELDRDYKTQLKQKYRLDDVNFNAETHNARDITNKANEWVSRSTRQKIVTIASEQDFSRIKELALVLLNTVHFEASWWMVFDPHMTKKRSFFNNGRDDQEVRVDMMQQSKTLAFADWSHKDLDCKAVGLPFKPSDKDGSMMTLIVIVPNKRDGLKHLIENLTIRKFYEMALGMDDAQVDVAIPKFSIDSTTDIEELLKGMGVESIFDKTGAGWQTRADRIKRRSNITIDKIIHRARISIDEVGVEAAAGQMVQFMSNALLRESQPEPSLVIDHPFMFVLVHQLAFMPVFMGTVNSL